MYEKKVGGAYKRGCLMTCGVYVVGGLLGLALVTTVLLLIDGGRVEPRSPRFTLALLMPFFLVAAPIAVGSLYVTRRSRKLDRAFERWGWKGRQSGAVMRSWHGELGGRSVNVWFHRGPTIEIYMECRPATRGAIHFGGPLIRAIGEALDRRQPLDPPPLDLEGASFYSYDEGWMRRLLESSGAESSIRSLLTDSARTTSLVFFHPNAVRYLRRFMRLDEITGDNVSGWLSDLAHLATAVDLLGPSEDALEPKRLEEWARTERGKHLNRMLLIVALVFALLLGTLFAFAWFNVGQ